ncbi:ESX-3 secretion system eccC3 domain protein [Mycobacterium kansasii 824]|nr:ESX-3 secretion system eccC3 domain protein [Mycobacterium kansasii 824]
MSRLIFEARRRLTPPTTRKGTITIEAPPQLPRSFRRPCCDARCPT